MDLYVLFVFVAGMAGKPIIDGTIIEGKAACEKVASEFIDLAYKQNRSTTDKSRHVYSAITICKKVEQLPPRV